VTERQDSAVFNGTVTARREQAAAATAERIAALDLSELKGRHEQEEEFRRRRDEVIATNEVELQQLVQRIATRERVGFDKAAAADALMAGRDVLDLDDLPRLEARRDALRAGLQELRVQRDATHNSAAAIHSDVTKLIAEAAEPLAEAIEDEAATLLPKLLQLFADAKGAAMASGHGGAVNLSRQLEPLVAAIRESRLIDPTPLEPSPAIFSAFDGAGEAMKLAKRAVPQTVQYPVAEPQFVIQRPGFAG
jgi:hypothetical protein